ncbi:hypothetical protein, partial [Paenibacillus elgii]|uniref:hypothetical protein n=1 Tax=Paenibacillus elgii TaxID=189691 RepID=UPI0021D52D9F
LKDLKAIKGRKGLLALRVLKDLRATKDLKGLPALRVLRDLKDLKGCFKTKLAYPGCNDLYLQQISSTNLKWLSRASLGSFFFRFGKENLPLHDCKKMNRELLQDAWMQQIHLFRRQKARPFWHQRISVGEPCFKFARTND